MIAQLKNEHDRLRDIARRLDAYLDEAAAPTTAEFSQLRWMLLSELSLHLASERRALDDWQARTGRRVASSDRSLDDALADHVVAWGGASIPTSWDAYRIATKSLLYGLRARMDYEEASVLPAMAA